MAAPLRTVADLVGDLRRLGIVAGQTVMVHASLRRLGAVERGAVGVIAALDTAVGVDGTLLMTLGAEDPFAWVNQRPEPERIALLADAPPFDPLADPAEADNGALAEVFRLHPGTIVSDHPEGRFGGRGRRAGELLTDVPWDHYYGPGSPLARLVATGGKVLRLGADIDTVTLLHHAEYLADVPDKRHVRRYRKVHDGDRAVVRVIECLDDSDGIVDAPGDYFGEALRAYLATGRASTGVVGGATSELIDGADLLAFATDWMTEQLARR